MAAPHPDIGALYLRHRDSMYGVAASVLRGTPQHSYVEDVVMETIASIIQRPPAGPVENWEAFLVRATRNKALDLLKSASSRHAGGQLQNLHHPPDHQYLADEVAEKVDRQRAGAYVWDALAVLDPRDRAILWEYKALGRTRAEVARKHGISPARVSQISTDALTKLKDELVKEGIHE